MFSRLLALIIKVLKKIRKVIHNQFVLISTKLSVFHQILIIIIMMVLFLLIQGVFTLGTINSMQQFAQTVFNENVANLDEIAQDRLKMDQIRNAYLAVLVKDALFSQGMLNELDSISAMVGRYKEIDPDKTSSIRENIKTVKEIMSRPVSLENYTELKRYFYDIDQAFEKLRREVMDSSISLITSNDSLSLQARLIALIVALVSAVCAVFIGLYIDRSISKPLKKMVNATQLLASGDLAQKVDTVGCPEITGAVNSLNQAITGLNLLMKQIEEQSSNLYTASSELKVISHENGFSAEEIARTMEELAVASGEQAKQVTEAIHTVEVLAEIVTKVADNIKKIATNSQTVAESAGLGKKATGDMINQINELYQSTQEMSDVFGVVNKSFGKIGEITGMIDNIAEQTSLLALNAAIEAARAGEYGRGFGIIAGQTGKLAEQSLKATQLISELIDQMKSEMNHAVKVFRENYEKVESGKSLAQHAMVTFESIFAVLMKTIGEIDKVADMTRQMEENNERVVIAIESIAAISEENLAATEEVSATTEQQTASLQQITACSEKLAEIAAYLKDNVATFKL